MKCKIKTHEKYWRFDPVAIPISELLSLCSYTQNQLLTGCLRTQWVRKVEEAAAWGEDYPDLSRSGCAASMYPERAGCNGGRHCSLHGYFSMGQWCRWFVAMLLIFEPCTAFSNILHIHVHIYVCYYMPTYTGSPYLAKFWRREFQWLPFKR